LRRYIPGVALCSVVGVAGWGLQVAGEQVTSHTLLEALVLALLLGVALRTVWDPGRLWTPGIRFTAREVLEAAVVLLGASVDLPVLLRAGPVLALVIVGVVVIGIAASMAIGRTLGLNRKLAILVACGNSICGNSAIAAVAPAIGADQEDVASAISFTAVLGVVVVVTLPLLAPLLDLSFYQYGVLAGMTVYAVPQVLAATFPVSALSGEVGTLVKLVRVLLLGPIVLFFALRHRRQEVPGRFSLNRFVPWFIIGFLVLATARSSGLLPAELAGGLREVSRWLTVAAMAALGLGVDIRSLRRVGRQVALAVSGSLIVLIVLSIMLIKVLEIG
jgi:uncharacterized integral membrane protein (TIGR00698 family)